MRNKKAQTGIELIIIIGALLFFVSIFLLTVQENMKNKVYQRENILVKEIALTVQNEINLALQSTDGYYRKFELPQKAGTLDYEISIDSKMVYIKTTDNRYALTVPTAKVIGNVNITNNIIEKINGVIYINK